MLPEKLKLNISKFLLFNTLTIFPIFFILLEKIKIFISELFAHKSFDNLSNFIHAVLEARNIYMKIFIFHYFCFDNFPNSRHAPREAQIAHLKFFASQRFDNLPKFLHAAKKFKKKYISISKLLLFSTLTTFPIFLIYLEKLKVSISKLLLLPTLIFFHFLHISREVQNLYLKIFDRQRFDNLSNLIDAP